MLYHLFYCSRGFYVFDKCVFCARFHVKERHLSDYLNNTLAYPRNYFCDFKEKVFLKKISLFAHYHTTIYSNRDDYGMLLIMETLMFYTTSKFIDLFYFINFI